MKNLFKWSLSLVLVLTTNALMAEGIGTWTQDEASLPCFSYTASLPFSANAKDGIPSKLPADPWFLLGNYRIKLFTHVSGNYQLVTGQRAWGRLNQGPTPNSGVTSSSLDLLDTTGKTQKTWYLSGMDSLATNPVVCQRVFGCGFASYGFETKDFTCTRTFSIKPSTTPYNGASAFLLTLKIKNKSQVPESLSWRESLLANYEMMQQQHLPISERQVTYTNTVTILEDRQLLKVAIKGLTADPLLFPTRDIISPLDGFPPSLFIKFVTPGLHPELTSKKENQGDTLTGRIDFALQPGEEKKFDWVIGYSFDSSVQAIEKICQQLQEKTPGTTPKQGSFKSEAAFSGAWQKSLSKVDVGNDTSVAQELLWHAYTLEALATYCEYFNETRIPTGSDFDLGTDGSARDICQNALPLCYFDPALVKTTLKGIMKRTLPSGEILASQSGNGFCSNHGHTPSDLQLYYFQLINEYVRATQDFDFLLELGEFYPVKRMPRANSLDYMERYMRFIRDEIGTGPHGLMRLCSCDWSDAAYSLGKAPFNKAFQDSESHMNTAMAIKVLGDLSEMLDMAQTNASFISSQSQIKGIQQSIALFRNGLLSAFTKDLGNRSFSRRMYYADTAIGETNLFLESQIYALQMKEISVEKKKDLYEEIKKALSNNEKIGPREQSSPEFATYPKGVQDNGGFFFSLNGPLILGVAQIDKTEAQRLWKNMSFSQMAKNYSGYWNVYWSAANSLDSSLQPTEGLPSASREFPVYSADANAWFLYCYYKLGK